MLGIGFDSGGSSTRFALDRGDGPIRVSGNEAGASVADARDETAVRMAVDWITDVIRGQPDDEICVWIGAAGFSAATAKAIQQRFAAPLAALRERFDDEGRTCEVFIANDAVSILKAPPLLGTGVVAIVDTGSVVMGVHPRFPEGVIQRGGYEWLVSDEGSAVWMTLQCIRLLLQDIQDRGARDYHSALLDRLADFLNLSESEIADVPSSFRALAKADQVARRMAESRTDAKRFFARFVYPHVFDLATLEPGKPHDVIAAEVLGQSVEQIVHSIRVVSDTLAAATADEANLRERIPLVVGGSVAANPVYDQRLRVQISSSCRFVSSVESVGDLAGALAALGAHYLKADDRQRRLLAKSFDPLHPVLRLL